MTMPILLSQELPIYTLLMLLVLPLYYLYSRACRGSNKPSELPTNWPILHMFPSLVANRHSLHDYCTRVLAGSGHNFRAHSPPGIGMRFFLTCDPANVRYIFTSNYTNFPKGTGFADIFDIMIGGIFTIDGEPARRQRAKIKGVFSSTRFIDNTVSYCLHKTEKNLLPLFTNMASVGTTFDVQEMMSRFMFDLAATSLFGLDPGLLSPEMPPMDAAVSLDTVMEVAFFRHIMPTSCWKLMRRLNIGPERKLSKAHTVLRRFVVEMTERWKRNTWRNGVDIMTPFKNDHDYDDDELSRALIISYMIAARDTVAITLTWLFYKLSQNPDIVSNIRNELSLIASRKVASSAGDIVIFESAETKSLVYLKAVLYETLRLYPPAAIERKTVATNDIMPSGHKVRAGDTIFICIQSMGRMEDLWGKDCLDYKPDRWLSEDGKNLRYVPSHKFMAFNSGPRICLRKDIAVMQMMTVIAATLWNFDVQVVEGQSIQPKSSCILEMKNGLKIKLKKRVI